MTIIMKDDHLGPMQNDYYYLMSIYVFLSYYIYLYGVQLFLLMGLSTLTVFRREMSCNREYTQPEEDEEHSQNRQRIVSDCDVDNDNDNDDDDDYHQSYDDDEDALVKDILLDEANFGTPGPLLDVFITIFSGLLFMMKDGSIGSPVENFFHDSQEKEYNMRDGKRKTRGISPKKCNCIISPQLSLEHRFKKPQRNGNFIIALPLDAQVHVLTFLRAREIITFSQSSRSMNAIINDETNPFSSTLWREIFKRDYHHIINWPFALEAFRRHNSLQSYDIISHLSSIQRTKTLYFQFGLSWMDWSIAGKNTHECCLVGLHGSVYDMTEFLDDHPGSPETVMMHAGRDATLLFEDMGHSKSARHLAERFRVIEDIRMEDSSIPMVRVRKSKVAGGLEVFKLQLETKKSEEVVKANNWKLKQSLENKMFGDVHVTFDALNRRWIWWYIGMDFNPVYIVNTK